MGYESCFENFPGPSQVKAISISTYCMIVLYLGVFAMAVHNTWFYLIKQNKYKIYLFTAFYVLIFTLIVSRVYYYIYAILYFHGVTDCKDMKAEDAKIISDYTRIVLGFFQCAQMAELGFRLQAVH